MFSIDLGLRTSFNPFHSEHRDKTAIELATRLIARYMGSPFEAFIYATLASKHLTPSCEILKSLGSNAYSHTIAHAELSGLVALKQACDMLQNENIQNVVIAASDSVSHAHYNLSSAIQNVEYQEGNLIIKAHGLKHSYSELYPEQSLEIEKFIQDAAITRHALDTYAYKSYESALFNIEHLTQEIISDDNDTHIENIKAWEIKSLKPLHKGVLTAATEALFADGACAIKVSKEHRDDNVYIKDIIYNRQKNQFDAMVKGIQSMLEKHDKKITDIDFFEIADWYACFPIYVQAQLNIPFEKINTWSGALTITHPASASGMRFVMSAARKLIAYNSKNALITCPSLNGEAICVYLER